MALQLPNNVSSLQDLTDLTLEVRDYARWFLQSSIQQKVSAHHQDNMPDISPTAKELLHVWGSQKSFNQQSLDELIAALEDFKNTAPSITITLAAPAPGDLRQTLVGWCREQLAPNMLVTFRFNSTILGGMVVRYGSRIFDWSFRRRILAARGTFPEVLRRV